MSEIPLLKYDNMIALKSIEDNAKGDGNEDGLVCQWAQGMGVDTYWRNWT